MQHDLLILRAARRGIRIESQPLQRVVEKGAADLDGRFAAAHPIVEGDHLLLRLGKAGVGADHQGHLFLPVAVRGRIDVRRPRTADLDHAGQEKILERPIDLAEGAGMPAEAVMPKGVRYDPAPPRLGPRERLVLDLDGLRLANGGHY